MPDTPNQPESWEQQLHDAANTIPDTEATPGSLREQIVAALMRVESCYQPTEMHHWQADAVLRVVDPLLRERDEALSELTRWQSMFGSVDTAQALLDGREAIAAELRDRAGQLRRECDEARAEVDRLRSRIADAHKVADRLQNNYLLPIMADALRDALDGPKPDPARETALDEMAYESARETTDFAAYWPINTREEQQRVPQPGDRVRVTWRKDGESISSGRFTEDTVDANGDYTGVSGVQAGWATVEVIEPAPPPCSECTGTAGWPNPDCPVHGVVARVREEMAARSSSTTPESGGTEEHGEPAPATVQPSVWLPRKNDCVTVDGSHEIGIVTSFYPDGEHARVGWPFSGYRRERIADLRPADTGKETDQ